MPTSSYMPNVVVEIAFNSGLLTPAGSRVWTDVSDYVELDQNITITHGRGDERSTADANQCVLTLDNRDGRFTPEPVRRNYVGNPSVEVDAAGWYDHSSGVSSPTWARQTGWAYDGTTSMRQRGTTTSAALSFVGSIVLPDGVAPGYTVAPGETWTAMAKVNVVAAPPPGSAGLWAEIFWFDGALAFLSQVNGATLGATVATGPQGISVTATAPASAAYMQAVFVMGATTNATLLDFYTDAVRVEKAAAPVSAYYPDVKLDRPIRVTATPVDGSAQVESLCFVNEWPVEWEGTDGYAKVTVSASSRMARLGTAASLKSIIEQEILADAPLAYYTLGEPAGALAANDSSGNQAPRLTITGDPAGPMVFGNAIGPGTDGLTAAQFTTYDTGEGGQRLHGAFIATPAALSTELFFSFPSIPANSVILLSLPDAQFNIPFGSDKLQINAAGVSITSATTVTDGATHHAAVVWNGATVTCYLDGVSIGSAATGGSSPVSDIIIGQTNVVTGAPITFAVAHVAIYGTALSAARVAAHASAGSSGFAGETTSARLVRYAGYAGIPAAEVVTETGQTTVQHIDITDQQVVELMRKMETTEGGVLFDDRDGTTALHNRAHRPTLSSSFTLDMAQQMVESGYSPKLDRSAIANDVTAADVSGKYTAHVFDAASKTDNGVATMSIETASEDDDEPLFQAGWALYKYKTPLPRVATLSVDCLAQVGKTPNCATVLAANVGSKLTVSNRPSQDSATSATFFVEGYTRTYGPESCVTTFNVSPTSPEDTTLIIGNATGRGVIGTNPIAL